MIIALPDGSRITLSTKSDSAGGALTITECGGAPKPVAFGQQLRALLAPLGKDAAVVHMDALRAWCRIALDRHSRMGVKANAKNRRNWERSERLLETALEIDAISEIREVA